MESHEKDGLQVSFDEESGTFTFEWDEEIHPEYNYLTLMTPEEFSNSLFNQLQKLIDDENNSKVQGRGSGCRTPEISNHPQPEKGIS